MVRDGMVTRTGGRAATTGVIPGDFALSVGKPDRAAPPGWRWAALSEVARLESGHTPSRRHPEYWGGDLPWIGIKDATESHGRMIYDTIEHTNDLGIANSSARVLPKNTVCLSRTASVGYVVVMGRPMATSQDFVNWVCSEALDYRFLKYVLLSEKSSFLRFASGTTHQTIYFPEVKAFHVCLPPLEEQIAIAEILSSLDDKIELNRRMSETLEAMARALFKSWFVDFDPARAKAEGRDPGLPKHIADLFPNRFVESELGEIPEGWSVCRLSDVTEYLSRGISPVYVESGGILVLNQKCVRNGRVEWAKGRRHDEQKKGTESRRLKIGDVLVNSTGVGTLGRVAQVLWLPEDVVVDSHVTVVRAKASEIPAAYLGIELRRRESEIESLGEGSTGQTELSRTRLSALTLIVPTAPVLDCFARTVSPLWSRVALAWRQSEVLSQIRDVLLPKLISGELRVAEAERVVEDAVA